MARKGGSYSYQKFMKEQARAEKKRKKLERKQQKAAEAAAKEEPAKEGDGTAPDVVDDGSASGTGT
ncbi:MAG: hypothetical protein JRG91_19655 [Deltaproteobacteria bacterium]|nr:hypothetical protein [Deltaproteobacteria bacterium]